MNLDLPVFNLKNLKRAYYNFLIVNVIITVGSILIMIILGDEINHKFYDKINTWIIIGVIFIGNYIYGINSKKELKSILEIREIEIQFSKYERFFKKRLAWNSISPIITGTFYIATNKNVFLYILITQMILSLLFYPNKKVISKELNNSEIVFT